MDAMNCQQGKGHSRQPPPAGINICNMTNNTVSISHSTCTLGFNQVKPPAMASETGPEGEGPDGEGEDDAADAVPGKKAADNAPKKKPPSGTPPKIGVGGLPLIGYHVIPEHEREITMEHARKNYPSRWVFLKNRHEHKEPWEHQGFPDEKNLQEFMAEINEARSETQKEATRAGNRHVIKNFADNR